MTSDSPRLRLGVLGLLALSLFAALLARLWFLQILTSPDYQAAANTNSLRTVTIQAPRGRVLDRNGVLLVVNKAALVVSVDYQAYQRLNGAERQRLRNRLAAELTRDNPGKPVSAADLDKRIEDPRTDKFKPVPVAQDVSSDTWVYLEEHAADFPTISVVRQEIRAYPYGTLAAHVLGYVGAINGDEYRRYQNKQKPYANNDEIGKSGVERLFENVLRGVPGKVTYEVDARGREVREVSRTDAIPGDDVLLTIDINLQAQAEKALSVELANAQRIMDQKLGSYPPAPAGSVVAENPQNGQVLAMASNPTYDPAQFVGGISTAGWNSLNDPNRFQPFLNRAVSGLYAPGSTFKLITAYAGLKTGILDPNAGFYDSGAYTVKNCTKSAGESCIRYGADAAGSVNLPLAITRSSDGYFYDIGDRLWLSRSVHGQTPIQDAAEEFGIGHSTGIGLADEAYSPLPSLARLQKLHAQDPKNFPNTPEWGSGNNINISIGQGDVLATPLQLANAYSTFANGGTRYQPTLLLAIKEAFTDKVVYLQQPKVLSKVDLPDNWHHLLLQGFEGVTTQPGGTATDTFQGFPFDKLQVAGKTGTAEIGKDKQGRQRHDTSLFVGFAPAENPNMVISAVMEQSGFGAAVAAPVVRDIFEPLANTGAWDPAPLGGWPLDGDGSPIAGGQPRLHREAATP